MKSRIQQLVFLFKFLTVFCETDIDYKAMDYSAEDSVSGSNEVLLRNYASVVKLKNSLDDGSLEDENKSEGETLTSVSKQEIRVTSARPKIRKQLRTRPPLALKPPPLLKSSKSSYELPPMPVKPPTPDRPPPPLRTAISVRPHHASTRRKSIPAKIKRLATRTSKHHQRHSPSHVEDDQATTTLVDYPFSVSVQRKGAHYASGALVDKRWILTSAGEFYNIRESMKLFRARLGSVDCKKGGVSVPLKKIEIHPSYVYGLPNYDLCLLRLAEVVGYTDFIRPIAFTTITTNVISAKFMITYWPRLIVNGHVLPRTAEERIKHNSIRVSTQRLIPRQQCVQLMAQKNLSLTESSLCLKPFKTHHTLCTPDAGAPVVAEDGLWGITSGWVSKDCRQDPSPTIFSRISLPAVRSWLDKHMLYGI